MRSSADVIFRYLMKGVQSYDLPVLNYDSIPARRRGKFNAFLDKLKLVTSSVKQTRKFLADPSNPRQPKTKNANMALYRVLCAKMDTYLTSQLQQFTIDHGKEDGYASLLFLRRLFADKDDLDYQQHTMSTFQNIRL